VVKPKQHRRELRNYSGNFFNFHLVGPKKKKLDVKCFSDDEEVKIEVRKWLGQQSKDFYVADFDIAMVKQWDKCINVGGGYIEK
jgi:hypothetical protein